jgi:hypothetical protein
MCYAVIGGAVCMTALLLIRSGVSTIPYRDGIRIPLEMVAGIAGIVVFMGFLQLVIAYILKARRRQ